MLGGNIRSYKAIEKVWPVTERLNREMLMVENLPSGRYALRAGGREIGRYSATELASGVNLAPLAVKPLKATLLNTGAALKTRVEMMPCNRFHFGRESLHVWGIPVGDLADECVVLRLDFAPGELDRILEGVLKREI